MRKLGYSDELIAEYVSYRFLGVVLLAFPFGLFIKGKKLKPFILLSTIGVPTLSWLLLDAVTACNDSLSIFLFVLWGGCFMIMQVSVLPFIMRNSGDQMETEAISLSYSTFAIAMVLSSVFIYGSDWLGNLSALALPFQWTELHSLRIITLLSFLAFPIMLSVKEDAPPKLEAAGRFKLFRQVKDYDWKLILRALLPTSIIAVGAGLTVPFINLFFNGVFGIDSDDFSLIGGITGIFIILGALGVPSVKRRFGYKVGITLSQVLAVTFLVILSLTELFAEYSWAIYVAILAFVCRQPLMNMAAPLTSDLVLKYVGPKNQELISALVSSIWNGSWVVSALIFRVFRAADIAYYQIFLLTAGLYGIGIFSYYLLILKFERREKVSQTGAN